MNAWFRLLRYLRPYLPTLGLALACMTGYAVMNFASLAMISPLMGALFGVQSASPLPGGRSPTGSDPLAVWPQPFHAWAEHALVHADPWVALARGCAIILVVFFLKNLLDYAQGFLMASVEQAAIRDLRGALFAHFQRLSLSFYHGRRTGALISRVTNDMEYLRASLAAAIGNLVKDGLTLVGAVIVIFVLAWKLALLALLILPPLALSLAVIGRKMRKRSRQAQEFMGDLSSILQEAISGVRVVKGFGREGYEQERFDGANRSFFRSFVRLRRVSAAARPVSEFAIVVVAVAMLWVGGREIFLHHALKPQTFVQFVVALLTMISPIKSLAEVNANVQQGVAAAQRVFSVMDTAPEVADRPGARPLPPFRDRIRYEGVEFAYDGGPPVLRDLSFELRRGQIVALVGSSGAGKSTAMDLLARFYDPGAGRITVDGADLRDVTVASLRDQLGIVTQETILFHDTVRNNIAYGRGGASDEEVQAAARAAHAHDFIARMAQGYDTVIGERGVKLSGGERQRLAIARALLRNPPVLLLDEATSSLDTESERLVQAALERLMHDRTVLVIAHRLSTVQHADAIVVLERGRVVAQGTHDELMGQEGVYRRLYNLQFVA